MKNLFKVIGIIALVAITILSFTACGEKVVSANFRFNNAAPPANRSVAGAERAIMGGTTVDSSFDQLNTYYSTLGTKVRSITPTEFVIGLNVIEAVLDGLQIVLVDYTNEPGSNKYIDFVNSITLSMASELAVDEVITAFNFILGYYGGSSAKISFSVPGTLNSGHWLKTATVDADMAIPPYLGGGEKVLARGTDWVTVTPNLIMPKMPHPQNPEGVSFAPRVVYYDGTVYKLATWTNPISPSSVGLTSSIMPNLDQHVIIPMRKITIPDTSSMTVVVSWHLAEIIEQYAGADSTADTADDIFVLAKDFWERLSISFSFN